MNELKKHSIEPFHMVVVNLYPFEKTIAKEGVTLEEDRKVLSRAIIE